MRRRICVLIALLVLVLTIGVQAVEPRTSDVRPNLSFTGTTANCSVICRGDESNDTVNATLTLYKGTTYVDSWSDSGTGRVTLRGSCKVESGQSYKLVVRYSVNGKSMPSASTTARCP